MANANDQHSNLKHFCRICKKGFMCGRALGGHMRAHGLDDDTGNLDDEDPTSESEDKLGNQRMYALRTNPNRLKSCRVCENCGKEFLSWKSFLEHRKCSSDDGETLVSSPESEGVEQKGYDDENHGNRRDCGWLKRKRSFNSICPSSEDEDLALAKCLMDLSNSRADTTDTDVEDSCASPSRVEQRRNPTCTTDACMAPFMRPASSLDEAKGVAINTNGMFACKACKKVFTSHQALGGHRASHKKVKGCWHETIYLMKTSDDIMHDEFILSPKPISSYPFHDGPGTTSLAGVAHRKAKVHKCSICDRVFASGQALGGHKRCHWLTSNMSDTSSIAKINFHEHIEQLHQRALALPSRILNQSKPLNLHPPVSEPYIAGPRKDPERYPLSLEVSTEINLHSLNVDHKHQSYKIGDQEHDHKNTNHHDIKGEVGATMEDDEVDSKLKLAKLSELKDMSNISGSSSSWLQVGIASTTDVGPPCDS